MGNEIRLSLLKGSSPNDLNQAFVADIQKSCGSHPSSDASKDWFHSSTLPLLIVNAQGDIVSANEDALMLLDHELDTVKTLKVSDLILRCDDAVIDLIFKLIPLNRQIVLDALCVRRNGSWLSCEIVVGVAGQPMGGQTVCLWLNEVKRNQEHDTGAVGGQAGMFRNESIEMASVVAGQIAHDFNNLLTPLLAYPELIRSEVSGNPEVSEYLDIIEKTAEDMRRLTQQLLTLARRGRVGTDVFSVNDSINQALVLLDPALPPGIKVNLDLAEPLLNCMGNGEQIRRVVENLVQNASESMGNAGTLSIRTENVYLDTPVGTSTTLNVGEYVKLTVADTGSGIPADIRGRIFDPFFTTKRALKQRGAGLGLSIVHGILRDHKGYIDVESVPGAGSTFVVYIPISRNAVRKGLDEDLPRGIDRILVVDDDVPQVEVLSSMLALLGYKVTGAMSGEECLNLVGGQGNRYDLVILDMVMDPGIDGLDTFRELRKLVPDQKVLLISGFARTTQRVAKAQELGAGCYLRKPLSIDSLAKAVRNEIDGTRSKGELTAFQNLRILIVDDDAMIRKLFGMIVLSEFPEAVIDQSSNGDEAIAAFSKRRYDLIVMDLQMPIRDGREAYVGIEDLCQRNGWAIPRVVFCTGFTPPESLHAIIRSNPRHCLVRKPVKGETLLECVRKVMRQ